MNDGSASGWPADEHFIPTDQDYGNLLDFDHLDIDFNIDYDQALGDHDTSQRQLTELAHSLDVQHLQNSFSPQVLADHRDGVAGAQQPQQNMGGGGIPHSGDNIFDFSMAMTHYGQDQMYRPRTGVPPTPNSIEMHGDPTRYLQQMDSQDVMLQQQGFHSRKEDASFTPLVSPAVTPHENRYQIPDFIIPGTYFSPLTSPALNAQNHQSQHGQTGQFGAHGSSAAASPLYKDVEMVGEPAMAPPEHGRRLRSNKRSTTRPTGAAARVRQSPIVKPARRKATVAGLLPSKEVSQLVEEAQKSKQPPQPSNGLEVPRSSDSSEFDSVSPETLSDMGPPPKPGSVTHSPAIFAQAGQNNGQSVCPATPASLMRLQQESPSFTELSLGQPELDDLTLPEPSLEKPPLPYSDTTIQNDGEWTPRISARKTPKLNPLSTPSASAAQSGKPSPMLSAVTSPTSPGFALGAGRKPDSRTGRTSKKRNSVSSTLVSPALRPKISPSIKPLLPDRGVSEDTHALLLASKSNYQNLLDGTTVPGVVYPTSLTTDLTSKRTSHKIAEQGRRNRINTALQELQALLPSPKLSAEDKAAADKAAALPETAAQSSNSKAAKVESAIEYIKELQRQVREKDRVIGEREEEVERLRAEVEGLRRVRGRGDTGDGDVVMEGRVEGEGGVKCEEGSVLGAENGT